MSFEFVNILHALNTEARTKTLMVLDDEYWRILSEDEELPKEKQLACRRSYGELFAISIDKEETAQRRLDALYMIFYKQNVYEIEYLKESK